ncbi:MAG: response regulator transcription factor [bacterium]
MYRVVIADDHAVFRNSLRDLLMSHRQDLTIEEAADGPNVLDIIENAPTDLVFMDIRMPGENGLLVTRRIKARHPKLPVIILTSYDLPEYREAARQAGADGFLTKGGSTPEETITLLHELLNGNA